MRKRRFRAYKERETEMATDRREVRLGRKGRRATAMNRDGKGRETRAGGRAGGHGFICSTLSFFTTNNWWYIFDIEYLFRSKFTFLSVITFHIYYFGGKLGPFSRGPNFNSTLPINILNNFHLKYTWKFSSS